MAICAAEKNILVSGDGFRIKDILEMVHSVLDLVHVSDSRLDWGQTGRDW